ncbi:MAG: hypothetical protein IAE82_03015 [Opitutaceae bacterium]|nr:hypothetical protein [Opitutaceae bacterium]
MIDPSNGNILFEVPAFQISAELTTTRYHASPLASLGGSSPSPRFTFQPVHWGGEAWAGRLVFRGGILHAVSLQVLRAEFGTSWTDASEEKELARKHCHEALARRALGQGLEVLIAHPHDARFSMLGRVYPWGRVRSFYDDKAGFSALEVEYHVESIGD